MSQAQPIAPSVPSEAPVTAPDTRGATYAVVILTAMNLLNYVDRYVPSAVKELFRKDLNLTDDQTSWPLTAFVLVYMVASPIFGSFSGRFARKWLISIGVALWSAATAAAAFATGFWTFLFARSLVGVGEAAYATLSPSILSDYFPPSKRNKVLTIFYVAIPVGAAVGYKLGGYLGQHYGWRYAFLACGLPGIATAALVLVMREPRHGQFDEEKAKSSVTWGEALRFLKSRPDYVTAVAGYTAVTFASGALADWFPAFLTRYRGFDVEAAGSITGITAALGGLIGTVLGGAGGDALRGRTRQPYFALSGVTMALATVFAVGVLIAPTRGAIWACMLLAQIALWCYNSPINTIIVNAVPAHLRPYAVSVSIFSIHAFGDAISPNARGPHLALHRRGRGSLEPPARDVDRSGRDGGRHGDLAAGVAKGAGGDGMIVAFLRALCLFSVRLFYRTIALGGVERLPKDGPCIVVANHPNGLLDPVVTRLALGRPLAFLAKSTLFGNPVGRAATKAFDAIPVFRQADKADTSQNERTFELCRDLLARRGWLMLFPEGTSHSDPAMKPLKTGAARIALSTEAANDFKLGLRIVPVGLLYEDKEIFRTRAAAAVGQPFTLESYAAQYRTDERGAVEALTRAINDALGEVVLEADSRELWNSFLAIATWTSADGGQDLAASEARARELAAAYRKLAVREPARATFVVEQTRRFAQVLRSVGVESPFSLESAPEIGVGSIASFFAPLVLLAPLALIGTILAWVPYRAVALLVRRMKTLESDITSTVKTIAGMLFFTVTYLIEAAIAGAWLGWWVGLLTLVAAPMLGYVAMRYWERVTLRREALRSWWLRFNRREVVDAVQARRTELCALVEQELATESGSAGSVVSSVGR